MVVEMRWNAMMAERSQLRAYLLGKLQDSPAEALDDRLFADDDFLRDLHDEQELLIEDHLAGRLPSQEEALFRAQCARSPELQGRVDSLRSLLVALKTTAPEMQPTFSTQPVSVTQRRFFLFASQALAMFLIFVAFLYFRQVRENAHLLAHIKAQSDMAPQLSGTTSSRPIAPAMIGSPQFLAFLSADVPRGPSEPPELSIPTKPSLLELQVEVRDPSGGGQSSGGQSSGDQMSQDRPWNVELVRGTETVWKSSNVPTRRAGQKAYLSLLIDSGNLTPATYQVRCSHASQSEAVQTRTFHIAAK